MSRDVFLEDLSTDMGPPNIENGGCTSILEFQSEFICYRLCLHKPQNSPS